MREKSVSSITIMGGFGLSNQCIWETVGVSAVMEYSYLTSSALKQSDNGAALQLATSGGLTADRVGRAGDVLGADRVRGAGGVDAVYGGGTRSTHPYFFSGFVEHPGVVAAGLLTVARVARTRFYVPPNMLAAVLRAADPVVTSTPEGLRFESFSACCGVYSRLDVLSDALDASYSATGVTNVDVNPPLREALAGLRAHEPLHLGVGDDELRVTTLDAGVVEEKVPLPTRWLKGFAETQLVAAGVALRHSLDAVAARAFIQSLPKSSATRTVMWATRGVRSLRLASTPSVGAVCLAGPERLRILEPLLRLATGLRAYGPDVDAASLPSASIWVLELPGARVTVSLSPQKSRGFSGEGGVLHSLAGAQVLDDAELLSTLLSFEPKIDIARLAHDTGLTSDAVTQALDVLASSGQVGFDVTSDAYFHRLLPLTADGLAAMHPRLADAQKLVDAGGVRADGGEVGAAGGDLRADTGQQGHFTVHSGDVDYSVQLLDGEPDRCTCPWFAQYRGTRGPCKHVLAARIASRGLESEGD